MDNVDNGLDIYFQQQMRKRDIEISLRHASILSIIARKQLDLIRFHRQFHFNCWTSIHWLYDEYIRKDAIFHLSTIQLTLPEFVTVYSKISDHLLVLVSEQMN